MAAPAPTAHTIACPERDRLLLEFARAVAEYNRLQSAQVTAILEGQDFPGEAELREALNWRDNAKYAVISHRDEHGC